MNFKKVIFERLLLIIWFNWVKMNFLMLRNAILPPRRRKTIFIPLDQVGSFDDHGCLTLVARNNNDDFYTSPVARDAEASALFDAGSLFGTQLI